MSCAICNSFTGGTTSSRKRHAQKHGFPTCGVCDRTFKTVGSFEKHVLAPHSTTDCPLCHEQVIGGKELEHAIEKHDFPNCFCGEKVKTTWSNFYRHMESHTNEPKECPCCDLLVPTWQTRHHATAVHGFPRCSVCDETINSNFGNFYSHIVAHKNEMKKCTVCAEDILVSDAKEHASTVHGFPHCPVCAKTVNGNYGNFMKHLAMHEVETKCPRCPEMIKEKNQKAHAESHACANCTRKRGLDDGDTSAGKRRKIKEETVTCFISHAFPSVKWTIDRRILGGSSHYRPDMVCDLGFQVLIVEIDENQHQDDRYNSLSEKRRLNDLSCDVDHRPVVFIRFNPDGYVDLDGKTHTSCFGFDSPGNLDVRRSKQAEWEMRLETLREEVDYWMRERSTESMKVVNLFFNEV